MKKIRRVYWVFSDRSTTLHRKLGTREGLAFCGRQVTPAWHWALFAPRSRPRCAQCHKAIPR